jgi:Opacity protein and related surface antigens
MKKAVFFVATLFITLSVFAQKDAKSVNFSLNYGTEIESVGIGGQFTYNLSERFRVAPDFTYFLENNNWKEWDLNLNAHYLFPLNDSKITIYPIAGFILTHWSFDDGTEAGSNKPTSLSATKVGFNLGGGMQYAFSNTFFFRGELKYNSTSEYYNQTVISAGLGFNF